MSPLESTLLLTPRRRGVDRIVSALLVLTLLASGANGQTQEDEPPTQEPPHSGGSPDGENEENSDPILLHSGEFVVHRQDFDLTVHGPSLSWERTYRSISGPSTAMGERWDHSFNVRVVETGNALQFHAGDGIVRSFPYDALAGTYERPDLAMDVTGDAATGYILTDRFYTRWYFHGANAVEPEGSLRLVRDRNGNEIAVAYANGRVSVVSDDFGQSLTVVYGSDGFIDSVVASDGRAVTYTHAETDVATARVGDLTTFTTPSVTGTSTGNDFGSGKTWTYTYDGTSSDSWMAHTLVGIRDPNGSTYLSNIYTTGVDDEGNLHAQVAEQAYGAGTYQYVYEQLAPAPANNNAVRMTVINDRVGNVEEYLYDEHNRLVVRREYTGRANPAQPTSSSLNRPTGKLRASDPTYFETLHAHSAVTGARSSTTRPDGSMVTYTYDDLSTSVRSRMNLLTVTETGTFDGVSETRTQSRTYNATYNVPETETDAAGGVTQHFLDSFGNAYVTVYPEVTLHDGTSQYSGVLRAFDGRGRVVSVTQADGRVDEFLYVTSGSGVGRLEQVTLDKGGRELTTTFTYDVWGGVASWSDANGAITLEERNSLGQVVRVTTPAPGSYWTTYMYDGAGAIVAREQELRDANDPSVTGILRTEYEYSVLGHVAKETVDVSGPNPLVTTFDYDANENLRSIVRWEAGSAYDEGILAYDERDRIFTHEHQGPGGVVLEAREYDYDLRGRPSKSAVGVGLVPSPLVTVTEYDAFGNLRREVLPNGDTVQRDYRVTGEPTEYDYCAALPTGGTRPVHAATWDYDARGRPTRRVMKHFEITSGADIGDGEVVREWRYDELSRVTSEWNDHGGVVTYEYDSAGYLERRTDPLGRAAEIVTDGVGNVTSVTQPGFGTSSSPRVTTYTYDERNMNSSIGYPGGGTVSFGYDSRGVPTFREDSAGVRWYATPSALGEIVKVELQSAVGAPKVVVGASTLDGLGRERTRTDANGNTTTYSYDALDRVVAETLEDGTSRVYEFDGLGNVDWIVDGLGGTYDYVYDDLGRVTREDVLNASGVLLESGTYVYDAPSAVSEASNSGGVVAREYDSLGNVLVDSVMLTGGASWSSTASYSGANVIAGFVSPANRTVDYLRDASGAVSEVKLDGVLVGTVAREEGHVQQISFANGLTQTYHRNADSGVSGLDLKSSTATLGEWTFGWDVLGNRTSRSEALAGVSHTYDYDEWGRLDEWVGPPGATTYSLDGVGNRVAVTGAVGAAPYLLASAAPIPADAQVNQYTVARGYPLEHDDNGNLTAICEYHAPSGLITPKQLFTYGMRGEIVRHRNDVSGVEHEYTYDALGRRLSKERFSASGALESQVEFVWLGNTLIEERRDGVPTTFVREPTDGHLMAMHDTMTWHVHTDDLGSPLYVTDGSGAVVDAFDYTDFGQRRKLGTFTKATNSVSGIPFGFAGAYADKESGTLRMGRRDYLPLFGRFAQRDPAGTWWDVRARGNGQQYAAGSPWVFVDRTGYASDAITKPSIVILQESTGTRHAEVHFKNPGGPGDGIAAYFGPAAGFGADGYALRRAGGFLEELYRQRGAKGESPADNAQKLHDKLTEPGLVGVRHGSELGADDVFEVEFEVSSAGFADALELVAWLLDRQNIKSGLVPPYNASTCNCMHFAMAVLFSAGIDLPKDWNSWSGLGGRGLFDWMQANDGRKFVSKGGGDGESAGRSPPPSTGGFGSVLSGRGRNDKTVPGTEGK